MGVAIENANAIIKVYNEQQETIARCLRGESMRVSQLKDVQYGISYLMATSASGTNKPNMHQIKPLDITVQLTLDVAANPNAAQEQMQETQAVSFSCGRDKFL